MRFIFVLTQSLESARSEVCLKYAFFARMGGHQVAVYLIGDGVFCAIGVHPSSKLSGLLSNGGEVYARKEDLEARGLLSRVLTGVEMLFDFYDKLIEDVMERADRVMSF